jgi:phenylacetate-CoA ligase
VDTPAEPRELMGSLWPTLRDAVAYAFDHTPFYRDSFTAAGVDPHRLSCEGWETVPFCTKDNLRSSYPFGMLAVDLASVAIIHESSGTTGLPTPSFFTRADLEDCFLRIEKNGIALTGKDRVVIKTPYSMLSTAHQMHGAATRLGACILPADNRSELMPYSRVVRLIKDYRPTVLYCIPIELMLFARKAISMGLIPLRDFSSVRACLVNGEMLSAGKRRFLERIYGARTFEDYGSTETTSLAGECAEGLLHCWEESYFYEVLCTDGACRAEGTGELVVTALRREGMPLIRYRVGDQVELRAVACKCGQSGRTVRVQGRVSDIVETQGRRFFPIEVEGIVYTHLIGLMPVFFGATYDDHKFKVMLEPMERDQQEVAARLKLIGRELKRCLGIDASFEIVSEGTLMGLDRDGPERPMNKPVYIRRDSVSGSGLNYKGSS